MSSRVCIDASLGLKLVLAEPDSDLARTLWGRWIGEETQVFRPYITVKEQLPWVRWIGDLASKNKSA